MEPYLWWRRAVKGCLGSLVWVVASS
jgi:hypothetical protein